MLNSVIKSHLLLVLILMTLLISRVIDLDLQCPFLKPQIYLTDMCWIGSKFHLKKDSKPSICGDLRDSQPWNWPGGLLPGLLLWSKRIIHNSNITCFDPLSLTYPEALKLKSRKIEKRTKPGWWVGSSILPEITIYFHKYTEFKC